MSRGHFLPVRVAMLRSFSARVMMLRSFSRLTCLGGNRQIPPCPFLGQHKWYPIPKLIGLMCAQAKSTYCFGKCRGLELLFPVVGGGSPRAVVQIQTRGRVRARARGCARVVEPSKGWSIHRPHESQTGLGAQTLPVKTYEKNYPTHDQELPAVMFVLKLWRHYLYGIHCEVFTNHRNLQLINSQRDLNMRQHRWLKLHEDYDITILYHKGKTNVVATYFSRKTSRIGNLAAISA
ncbi:hypothetical protein MTR67_026729 [Solanum verrucosum]|uniref:Reverse transcriptase RNase H-like domain-containing protein n=1 Tax=Solanum verrucosum TaxID=315347 RepID=A0AAF0QZH4_SOLVR|nr:hypothetical protein MTR67_026729 [Solanum verrucosum]